MAPVLGIKPAGKLDGTQHRRRKGLPDPPELRLHEAIIKPGIVGNKDRIADLLPEPFGDILKGRRIRHHRIGNAGKLLDKRRDRLLRIHQRLPVLHHLPVLPETQPDLGNPVPGGAAAGGFKVDKGEFHDGYGPAWS